MFKIAKSMLIVTHTPTHAGSGSDLGVVDLPIQREKHTTYPKVEGSSLKGCIRDSIESVNGTEYKGVDFKTCVNIVFGPENDGKYAGAIAFSDAKILLFPVKSAKGVFAWATCPLVLKRFLSDMAVTDANISFDIPESGAVATKSAITLNDRKKVMLEEFLIEVKGSDMVDNLADTLCDLIPDIDILLKQMLKTNLIILKDDDFKDFVNLSTEVITRTKIDNKTGTVANSALFNAEYLPSDAVMYALTMASPLFFSEEDKKAKEAKELVKASGKADEEFVIDFVKETLPNYIQLGGDYTLGKGIVSISIN